jgi:hypothetical protein
MGKLIDEYDDSWYYDDYDDEQEDDDILEDQIDEDNIYKEDLLEDQEEDDDMYDDIRDLDIGNIDIIRKHPEKYLELQWKIIQAKIDAEKDINKKYKKKVILVDRSLIDSYFYYTFYVDKAHLSNEFTIKYNDYLTYLFDTMNDHVNNLYTYTFFCKPIVDLQRQDNYTQSLLKYTQMNEYRHMELLSLGIYHKSKLIFVDILKDLEKMELDIRNFNER